jgi:hypothetical protein
MAGERPSSIRRVAGPRRREPPGPGADERATASTTTSAPAGSTSASAPVRALRLIGAVLAPTTVLTGLLWYFGKSHASALMRYLGVQETVLSYTSQDYLTRSADTLFTPLMAASGTTLIALWGYRILRGSVSEEVWQRVLGGLVPLAILAGSVLEGIAVDGVLRTERYRERLYLPGLCLALGTVLLDAGLRALPRVSRRLEQERFSPPAPVRVVAWGATFVLVSVGLFWATQTYAAAVGRGRAMAIVANLAAEPDAVLYSAKRLNLGAPGVYEARCSDPASAFPYRYDGLKLIIMSGDHYLLLPETWTYQDGVAVVIRRDPGVRLEFAMYPQPLDRPC